MNDSIAILVSKYRSLGLNGTPWSEQQIKSLEEYLVLFFHLTYKAYLLIAGENPPLGLEGSDCHGDYLFDLLD